MPSSSSSWSTTRNFISEALPYALKQWNKDLSKHSVDLPCAVALCTSSSFINGSLAPELLMKLQTQVFKYYYTDGPDFCWDPEDIGREKWVFYSKLAMIMLESSSTLQFINSLDIVTLNSRKTLKLYNDFDTAKFLPETFLLRLIFGTRYFIRQCQSIRLELPFASKAIFDICLPRLTALRKLIISDEPYVNFYGESRSRSSQSSSLIRISESDLITALVSARNLDTLGLGFNSTRNMKDDTLEKIWKVNEMKYLRTLEFRTDEANGVTDLLSISTFHPKLTSLLLHCRNNTSSGSDFTPPNLTLMTELTDFRFHCSDFFDDIFNDGDFFPSPPRNTWFNNNNVALAEDNDDRENSRQEEQEEEDLLFPSSEEGPKERYLKYLTHLEIICDEELVYPAFRFIERLDGSLLLKLEIHSWNPPRSPHGVKGNDDCIELITNRFPQLEILNINTFWQMSSNFFRSIGTNSFALQKLLLPHRNSALAVDDEAMSFIFDPEKCTSGLFSTLQELTFGVVTDETEINLNFAGTDWFGAAGMANGQKNCCLKLLDLSCLFSIAAEGLAQMCTALAHCLETLAVNIYLRGRLEEAVTQVPPMRALTKLDFNTTWWPESNDEDDNGPANAAVLFRNCPDLNFVRFSVDGEGISGTDRFAFALAKNFIEHEQKFLTLEFVSLHHRSDRTNISSAIEMKYHPLLAECYLDDRITPASRACQIELARLRTLRRIHTAPLESDWQYLKKIRPDIMFSPCPVENFYER